VQAKQVTNWDGAGGGGGAGGAGGAEGGSVVRGLPSDTFDSGGTYRSADT